METLHAHKRLGDSRMNILDLFSGIGGFSLAGHWAGYETLQFVEIDPFCQKVLNKNFPGVPIHDDIKTFDATQFRGRVDLLTAGTPCQPASIAGKRKGKEDDRWLWHEVFRVVRDCKPTWLIIENVPGLLSLEGGVVFEDLLLEVEALGYETQTLRVPACGVNAPHRRERIWIIANSTSSRSGWRDLRSDERRERVLQNERCGSAVGRETERRDCDASNAKSEYGERSEPKGDRSREPKRAVSNRPCVDTNTDNKRLQGCGEHGERAEQPVARQDYWQRNWVEVASSLCRVDDGLPRQMDRAKRLKALGNSIVPQVAFEIMKAIKEIVE